MHFLAENWRFGQNHKRKPSSKNGSTHMAPKWENKLQELISC